MTTPALRIGRLHARYRLAPDARATRERLDRVLADLLDDALERAVERAGLPATGELCIHRVHAPVRLRLGGTDAGLREAWTAAIADALRRAAAGETSGVVRYASRRQALVDVAAGVAAGDLERAWAWRRLGLWDGPDNADAATLGPALVRALVAEREAIVPVIGAVARGGGLPGLGRALDGPAWLALAVAALGAAGAREGLARIALDAARDPARSAAQAPAPAVALAAVARSPILDAADAAAAAAAPADRAATAAALAVLACLEADPALALAGDEPARAAIAAATQALVATPPAPRRDASLAEALARDPEPRAATLSHAQPASDPAVAPDEGEPVVHRTAAAGLLFVVHLVEALGLADELATTLEDRLLRWTLHRLGMMLAGVEPDDPAALAFAGLGPDTAPPSRDGPPPTADEEAALARAAERVAAALDDALEADDALARVCARDGEVRADPGWIELRLALDAVDLDVRRAGLDLDPGFIPWLGTVIRFVYD
jgi:hypothetical protein